MTFRIASESAIGRDLLYMQFFWCRLDQDPIYLTEILIGNWQKKVTGEFLLKGRSGRIEHILLRLSLVAFQLWRILEQLAPELFLY